jgi:hypothetical protein
MDSPAGCTKRITTSLVKPVWDFPFCLDLFRSLCPVLIPSASEDEEWTEGEEDGVIVYLTDQQLTQIRSGKSSQVIHIVC